MSDNKLSRRDFLKLAREGARDLVLASWVPGLTDIDPIPKIEIPLNLDNVNLDSSHSLNNDVITDKTGLVLGETDYNRLRQYYGVRSEELDYSVLNIPKEQLQQERKQYAQANHGIGSPDNIHMLQMIVLDEMRRSGLDFVVTDRLEIQMDSNFLKSDTFQDVESISFAGKLFGELLSVAMVDLLISKRLKLNNDSIVSIMGVTEIPVVVENFINLRPNSDIMKQINQLSGEVYEYLIIGRNLNMVINTNTIRDLLSQNLVLGKSMGFDEQGQKEIAFFAGGAHRDVKHLFKETDEELKKKIEKHIKQDIQLGLRFASGHVGYEELGDLPEVKSIPDLLNLWKGLVGSYSFPVATFYTKREHQDFYDYKISPSPREIFWRELINEYYISGDESRESISKLVGFLAENDVGYFNLSNRTLPPVDAMFMRMNEARKSGSVEEFDLSFIVPRFVSESKNIKLIFFEGVPYVVDSKDLS